MRLQAGPRQSSDSKPWAGIAVFEKNASPAILHPGRKRIIIMAEEKGWNLLVVDDDPDALIAIQQQLSGQPYAVFTAQSGQQGLEIMARRNIQVVLTDLIMPRMNGTEFLRHVQESWPSVIRLMLSRSTNSCDILDAVNAGRIYGFICKPWRRDELFLHILKAFQLFELNRERDELLIRSHRLNRQLIRLNQSLERRFRSREDELENVRLLVESLLKSTDHSSVLERLGEVISRAAEGRRFALYQRHENAFTAVCSSSPLFTASPRLGYEAARKLFEGSVRDYGEWRALFPEGAPVSGEVFCLRRDFEVPAFLIIAANRRPKLPSAVVERIFGIMPLVSLVLQMSPVGEQ